MWNIQIDSNIFIEKNTFTSLTKRELLAFSAVDELPNASSKILESNIISANCVDPPRKFKMYFEVSVFPDAVSPEIMTDWDFWQTRKFLITSSAIWKKVLIVDILVWL